MKQRTKAAKEQLNIVLRQKEETDKAFSCLLYGLFLMMGVFIMMAAAIEKRDVGQYTETVISMLVIGAAVMVWSTVSFIIAALSPNYKCEECGYEHKANYLGGGTCSRRGRTHIHCTMCDKTTLHVKIPINKESEEPL